MSQRAKDSFKIKKLMIDDRQMMTMMKDNGKTTRYPSQSRHLKQPGEKTDCLYGFNNQAESKFLNNKRQKMLASKT